MTLKLSWSPASRSLDFRQQNASTRRSTSQTIPSKCMLPSVSAPFSSVNSYAAQPLQLTTEYTPRDRGVPAKPSLPPSIPGSHPGPDPSSFPPATAPPSHPSINPDLSGMLDGRSILDVDLSAMAEKPWRRPGSDISDWFNYGFDEISWEAYCYRRRDLGDLASVLKTNVLNFAAMTEDHLTTLPPELRTMVMTGANAMMNQSSSANMMGPNVGPGPVVTNGTPEQGVQMGMQDGFGGGAPGPGMMGMGMGGDYGMQEQGPMGQGMYPAMEGSNTPVPAPVQTPTPGGPAAGPTHAGRGGPPPAQFRGRAMAQGLRGRGMFAGRGRGRYDGPPPGPVRPASPLPPGVPTGPRNQNRYKDRDGNAPAVEGLDYGGTAKDGGGRTPSGEPEDRGHSRKRRSSPSLDDTRGTKRR
ncbi:Fip1 motif-domain-containing protein [Pisolithus marmoratus]|nr:Fip1 motif-domain-containing protein [Pisolithus marmoratus]